MNQPQSIYKTDFVPYGWMQNNFTSNSDDFCSPENIDDCVQYISQEFCALGYPSIYIHSNSSCPSAANCDIVALLNVTFELLGCTKDHTQAKDDLECRNQRLSSDVISLNKKNAQLKEDADHLERKYRSALERERQLKEKNAKLTQAIKNEKNEVKKLSSQIQQQKVSYQHEVRKCENNVNQLKTRLKQIIADKNPDKKVASVSSSNLLQRNSRERGKWKTGTVAKSNMEEMYNSLISTYENRAQEMMKEVADYQLCLEYVEREMKDMIGAIKDDEEYVKRFSKGVPLHVIWNEANKLEELKERFGCLLCGIKESVFERIDGNLRKITDGAGEKAVSSMISMTQELSIGECFEKLDCAKKESNSDKNLLELKEKKLQEKEKELSVTASLIEKEKANLECHKLDIIKMAMQQENAKSEWHRNLKSSPSFSVITAKNGLTAMPSSSQLKQCHSAPNQQIKALCPLWNMAHSESSKEPASRSENLQHEAVLWKPKEVSDFNLPTCDLPKWASGPDKNGKELGSREICLSETLSTEEFDLSNISLTEEQNLDRLKTAFEDMERRRNQPSC